MPATLRSSAKSGAAIKPIFAAQGSGHKQELLNAIPEGLPIGIYCQDDWLDLCRGPHLASTGQICSAFRLTRVAGAYWRDDAKNHRLGREMDLYHPGRGSGRGLLVPERAGGCSRP